MRLTHFEKRRTKGDLNIETYKTMPRKEAISVYDPIQVVRNQYGKQN